MERMLARVQVPQTCSTPRRSVDSDHPDGSPPSGASAWVPQREHVEVGIR